MPAPDQADSKVYLTNRPGKSDKEEVAAVKEILRQVSRRNIWRPVYTPDHQLLSPGIGGADDGLAEEFFGYAFQGKTAIDPGCDLGYYTYVCTQHPLNGPYRFS